MKFLSDIFGGAFLIGKWAPWPVFAERGLVKIEPAACFAVKFPQPENMVYTDIIKEHTVI